MPTDALKVFTQPTLKDGRLILAFTGWMDGGDVSTGTVRWLAGHYKAKPVAEIEPANFYIYNFPGSMEIASLFRPHAIIRKGMIKEFHMPANTFFCAPKPNLLFFAGQEPNLNWPEFAEHIFNFAGRSGISTVHYIGTFAGAQPHTREPRLFCSVSDAGLKPLLQKSGVKLSDYEGPSSFATYLMTQAAHHGLRMASLVAEIPGYITGTNPLSIEAMTRRLAKVLNLKIDLAEMRQASDEWESRVTAAAAKDPDLAQQIRKLEEQYDDELIAKKKDG